MNKNYIIINDNGTVIGSTYVEISQGNNKVDELYIGYRNYTQSDGYVTIAPELPDHTILPELSTSNADFRYGAFTYDGTVYSAMDYSGFKYVLTDALTSQAGTLKLTIRLKNNTTNIVLCSSVVNLTIHASVVPSTPTITSAQYDAMSQTITDNYNTLNTNKLEKVFTNYSPIGALDEANDKVILNQGGVPKYAKLNEFYNILEINGVAPSNKSVTLDSGDIPHDNTTVETAIDSLETNVESRAYKYQLDDKVSCRDGTLSQELPIASDYRGLLPIDITTVSNQKIEIELDGYDFELGDILSMELYSGSHYQFVSGSFVKVIDSLNVASANYYCVLAYEQSLKYITLNYKLQDNKITIESNDTSFIGLPTVSVVRP